MSEQKPRQRKKRHRAGDIFIGIIGLIALVIALTPITSGILLIILSAIPKPAGPGVSTTPSGTTGTPSLSATHVAAPARFGSYFDIQDSLGDTYRVALTKIIDPAKPFDQLITPDKGKRFVGAVFTIKATSAYSPQQEDAYSNASLVGSDGQTYLTDGVAIVGYTDFNVGEIYAAQGQSAIGAVAFQVPNGVSVSKVQWSTFSSFGVRSTVQWNVP